MHGSAPFPLFAAIAIPTAWQCFMVLGPLAGLMLLYWLFTHVDRIIHRLFPSLEWNRELGWLNIRAERRATAFFRWLHYVVYAGLAAALAGIVWSAIALREVWQWSDPMVLGNLLLRLPVLVGCLALWIIYLGLELVPKLRREYEAEELENFRAAMAEAEQEEHRGPRHQPTQIWSKSPLPQQRPNSRR